MKKIFIVFIMLIMLTALCSCLYEPDDIDPFTASGQDNDSLTIMYNYMSDTVNECVGSASRIFRDEHAGIKLNTYQGLTQDVFNSDAGYDLFEEKLAADMMAGKGPDLLILGDNYIFRDSIYKKMDAGVFYDLNKLIDHDEGFNSDLYLENAMKSGLYQGKRYFIPVSYNVPIFITTEEKMRDYNLLDDMLLSYESLIDSWGEVQTRGGQFLGINYPWFILGYTGWLSECVDLEKKEVCLDTPAFERFMEVLRYEEKKNSAKPDSEKWASTIEEFIEYREKLFLPALYASTSAFFLTSAAANGDTIKIYAVPDAFGEITAFIDCYVLISTSSKNLQNAWDYIEILLDEHIQKNILNIKTASIGVNKEYIDGNIDNNFSEWEGKFRTQTSVEMKIRIKDYYHNFDHAVILGNPIGNMVYGNMVGYINLDKSFYDTKFEFNNYLNIWLSE